MVLIASYMDHTLCILFLIVGGFLILNKMIFRFDNKSMTGIIAIAALSVITLCSIWAYTRFGKFHEYGQFGNHTYHYSEIYQYSMGTKYLKELGYFGLYDFTYVAMRELQDEGVKIPSIVDIRSLKDINAAMPAEQVYQLQKDKYLSRFSPKRWDEFKGDLKTFLSFGWETPWWQVMLFDLGFNPPPTWNIIPGLVANTFHFSQISMELFPLIDITLLFIIAAYFILRSFGFYPLCGYLIVLGTNGIANYAWTGGSFFRYDWIFCLILALCFLKDEKYLLSGIFFGMSAAFRIFPLVFFIGALWALLGKAYDDRSFRKKFMLFLGSGVLTIAILFAISVLIYGTGLWHDFWEKIVFHNNQFFPNHISFKKFFVFSKDIGNQDFWFVPGLKHFAVWQQHLHRIIHAKIYLYVAMVLLMLLCALISAWRMAPHIASFVLGGSLLFLFSMPANYYYVYLAILPALFFSLSGKWLPIARMALTFALMVGILFTPLISEDAIIGNGYINTFLFYFFVAIYITCLVEKYIEKEAK